MFVVEDEEGISSFVSATDSCLSSSTAFSFLARLLLVRMVVDAAAGRDVEAEERQREIGVATVLLIECWSTGRGDRDLRKCILGFGTLEGGSPGFGRGVEGERKVGLLVGLVLLMDDVFRFCR